MSFLADLFNPPSTTDKKVTAEDQYLFDNGVHDTLNGLTYVMNPSVVTNANFNTLGSAGTTPVTQADGDNAEWSAGWNVVGSGVATYSLTSTAYPLGLISSDSPSTVQTASGYYEKIIISAFAGGAGFYLYQRQNNTVRKYQKNYLTYGLIIRNNENSVKKIRCEVYSYYDTENNLQADNTVYLKPGLTKITSQVLTEGLSGKTLGAGNYTEFRISFLDLGNGTANLDFYQIKCEFGKVGTLLQQ